MGRSAVEYLSMTRNVSFAFVCLSFAGHLTAMVSPFWFSAELEKEDEDGEEHERWVYHGLWKLCDTYLEGCWRYVGSNINVPYLRWCQAVMCTGLACYAGSLVGFGVWLSRSPESMKRTGVTGEAIFGLAFAISAGFCTLTTTTVFGVYYNNRHIDDPFGWTFVIAILSGCLVELSGIPALAIVLCCGPDPEDRPDPPPATALTAVTTTDPHITVYVPQPHAPGPDQPPQYYPETVAPPAYSAQPQVQPLPPGAILVQAPGVNYDPSTQTVMVVPQKQ